MERAEMMIIECEADDSELVRITPSHCDPSDKSTVKVFFANNRQPPNSVRFSEAGVMQEVLYRNERMMTIPYIWVSDDMAMLGGRELYGMPKLMMDDYPLRIHANQVFARVARHGVVMLEGSIVQLIRLQVTNRELVDHLWFGRGHIETRHPLVSRLDLLGLKATGRAWYGVFRWRLPPGEIVEEYEA
jgi:acetoacetate decarboxylase